VNDSTLSFAGELSRHGFAPCRISAGVVASLAGTILGYLARLWRRRAAAHLNTTQHLPARPAEKESIIVANFESWLSKAGKVAVIAAKNVVANIRPAAEEAQKLEPVEDLVLGPYGSDFNLVVDSVVSVEQAYAILAPQGGAGTEKVAKVLQLVESVLLPKLVAAGMTSEEAGAYIRRYIDAAVLLLNGPLATSSSALASGSSSTTEASTSTASGDAVATTADTSTADAPEASSSAESTTATSSDAIAEASMVSTTTGTGTTAAAA